MVHVGRIIPPNSVVMGSPGKVVRECTDRDREMIESGWQSYQQKLKKWLALEGRG